MVTNLLSAVVAAIVNALLGRFFPGHPKITPETVAQAQRDRADTLQSQKDASREADHIRTDMRDNLSGDPQGVFKHDANERPSD